jgi:hypothetical protein
MNELKMRCVKSDASNSPLRRFRQVVFSVTHDRVTGRCKLHSDLILQSRDQGNSDERSAQERAFDGISQLGTSRLGVALGAQPLKHPFPPKVMHEVPFLGAETPANYREILPHRSVAEKLSNERIPIRFSFRKEQNPGSKTIDTMYDKGSLSLQFQFCGKKRQSGRSIGASNRHSRKSGGFIEDHYGIVFVKHDRRPRKTRPSPILAVREVILLS